MPPFTNLNLARYMDYSPCELVAGTTLHVTIARKVTCNVSSAIPSHSYVPYNRTFSSYASQLPTIYATSPTISFCTGPAILGAHGLGPPVTRA